MEILVQELVERLEKMKSNELDLIQNLDLKNDRDVILIYSGKVLAFEICIKEIKRMINYHNRGSINK